MSSLAVVISASVPITLANQINEELERRSIGRSALLQEMFAARYGVEVNATRAPDSGTGHEGEEDRDG